MSSRPVCRDVLNTTLKSPPTFQSVWTTCSLPQSCHQATKAIETFYRRALPSGRTEGLHLQNTQTRKPAIQGPGGPHSSSPPPLVPGLPRIAVHTAWVSRAEEP